MRILGIESTCDETGAAVVLDGTRVLSNVVATQVELHAKYRGVVPEIASRAHIENILPVVKESLANAACGLAQIDAVAVAHRPGLIGSLLIGVTAAKTLAWALGKPLVGVDHVHAHLYSVLLSSRDASTLGEASHSPSPGTPGEDRGGGSAAIAGPSALPERTPTLTLPRSTAGEDKRAFPRGTGVGDEVTFPSVGLVVSGGHTALYDVRSWTDVSLIGSTIDDAIGEAYDKVAAILGLGYPGGPIIDKLAQQGDPRAVKLPRSMLGRESLDFSFSGLKTAVLYHVRGVPGRGDRPPPLIEQHVRDIAASFQAACVDTIVKKLRRALDRTGANSVIIGGGVSANSGLRDAMQKFDLPVHFPAIEYCTDNAAMTAGLAHVLLAAARTSPLDLDAITYSQFRAV